jgi:hypothetical protein
MRERALALALLAGACTTTADPPTPAAAPSGARNVPAALLQAHNRERAAAGAAPLVWSPALAAAAARYASQLATTGRLQHSPRQARPGQGENLWMGTRGAYPPEQMVASWASERAAFRAGIFPTVSRTGNWADVGHYSQMIWSTTTQLGCALASGHGYDFLVCRYAPAGNIDGRRVP